MNEITGETLNGAFIDENLNKLQIKFARFCLLLESLEEMGIH